MLNYYWADPIVYLLLPKSSMVSPFNDVHLLVRCHPSQPLKVVPLQQIYLCASHRKKVLTIHASDYKK